MIQRGVRFNRSRFYTDENVKSIGITERVCEDIEVVDEELDSNPTSLPRKLSKALEANLEV